MPENQATPNPNPQPSQLPVAIKSPPSVSVGTLIVAVLLAAILAFMVADRFRQPAVPAVPSAPVDSHFTSMGKAIEPQVAQAYAQAWLAFAQALDAGQPFSAALKAMDSAWTAARQKLAGPLLAELAKVVPSGTADAAITPAQRAAASAAARGIAQGLTKGEGFHLLSLPGGDPPPPESPTFASSDGPARGALVARTLTITGPPEAPAAAPRDDERATLPPLRADPEPVPAPAPAPAWHWRYFIADPRVEAWGYLGDDGAFHFTETRWRQ